MNTLPKFSPLAPVVQDQGKFGRRIDHEATPRCVACGGPGPVDADGLDVACWRAGPWAAVFLEARGLGAAAQEERRVLEHENRLMRSALEEVAPEAWSRLFPGGVTLNTGERLVAPLDEVSAASEAREVPRLTDESGPAGVAVEVAIVSPKMGPPRRRP